MRFSWERIKILVFVKFGDTGVDRFRAFCCSVSMKSIHNLIIYQILKRVFNNGADDVGFEDESENVYEEDFDVEEERTEISVSRYDIPDVFTQKGSQGK